ncbi:hypothetical protein NMB32_07490 [Stenotrophomonas sp. CD2]|nr:hypothetical protein NMB32_07490 [Stenotrophomonas sp. CD2]
MVSTFFTSIGGSGTALVRRDLSWRSLALNGALESSDRPADAARGTDTTINEVISTLASLLFNCGAAPAWTVGTSSAESSRAEAGIRR